MGVPAPLPDPDARGRPPTGPLPARPVQRAALRRQDRLPVAVLAPRPAAVDCGLPTSAPLVARGRLRADRPRPADGHPYPGGPPRAALGRDPRRPHAAIDAGERW